MGWLPLTEDGVGSRKHAKTCRRGEAKHPEEEGFGPEERGGKTAENGVEGFKEIIKLVLHFVCLVV